MSVFRLCVIMLIIMSTNKKLFKNIFLTIKNHKIILCRILNITQKNIYIHIYIN